MKPTQKLSLILGLLFIAFYSRAEILHVPGSYPTIQAAIDSAAAGDTILIANGTYPENIHFQGKQIVVASYFLTSGDTTHIAQTIIDGGGAPVNQSVVTFDGGETEQTRLVGLTLTNGFAEGGHGGGITLNNGASPRIEDCRIVGNIGSWNYFAGIGIRSTGSSPIVERCLIQNNSAVNNANWDHYGGGAYLSGGAPVFNDCRFDSNRIGFTVNYRNYGGGIFCDNTTATFRNCSFSNNSADHGGGLEMVNSSTVTLQNCRLENNYARDIGGGVLSWSASQVTVDSCVFLKNHSNNQGGAIITGGNGQMTVQYCTITDNRSPNGGAIFARDNTSPVITNCIIFYNWPNEILPATLNTITYCDVRGGYPGNGNLNIDPLFCDWWNEDYTLAENSACLTGGDGGNRMGYYGIGCSEVYPQILNVPQSYPTIQAAILASYQGDTVLVAPGTYHENIDFWGRRVLLASNYLLSGDTADISATVLDGGGATVNQSVVSMTRGEDSLAMMVGFTITNGYTDGNHGGGVTITNKSRPEIRDCRVIQNVGGGGWARGVGVFISGASPLLERCLIANNSININNNNDHIGAGAFIAAGASPVLRNCRFLNNQIAVSINHRNYGGGAYIDNSSPRFIGCYFFGNTADYGGAIEGVNSPNLIIQNCLITGNYVRDNGAGVYLSNSSATLINNTFSGNLASGAGGGILCDNSSPTIMNTILWEDSASSGENEIHLVSGTPSVSYSDIQGSWSGTGNIEADPLFADTVNYYLTESSPCVDAGNPDPAYNDPENPNNPGFALFPAMGTLRNDMGAYGGPHSVNWIITAIDDGNPAEVLVPEQFELYQNFPNPFNPETRLRFQIARAERVKLVIYDMLGREVKTLIDHNLTVGNYEVRWDGKDNSGRQVASSIYFYRLTAGSFVQTRKMTLLR